MIYFDFLLSLFYANLLNDNYTIMGNQNMYFLAIVPPPEICNEIITIQTDLGSQYQTVAALKVVPHITLKSPFRLPADQHEFVLQWFLQITLDTAPFNLELRNFNAFTNPAHPVIFIQPLAGLPLFKLQKHIIRNFQIAFPDIQIANLELEFKPHLTVAYRDLRPDLFREAWQEYGKKHYSASFNVVDFQLLQHDGRHWNVIQNYTL